MQSRHEFLLMLAGCGGFLGGLLHVVALIGGPRWIAAIGAPPWVVQSAQRGTWIAPVGALVITVLMWLCSAYAFSGAGMLRRLPLLRTGLFSIALVCILRGIVLVPLVVYLHLELMAHIGSFEIIASMIWLIIGLFFAFGLHGMPRKHRNPSRPG
ncbi:hypothetical protein ELE36_03400 [Pseudolysobacter antarcticus]|uniref:Uncharacterized protein n=1 Tax=Pseudolysobacter antarcticus TaxID=2511995 RepID=A0A411HG91_9GAMM|nr:hypothetical protein [Pseudolysobacter antarcticus]QBB69499.1 hypothetical protein ELE36_03400 [Pseudolysobacter antarcticus]